MCTSPLRCPLFRDCLCFVGFALPCCGTCSWLVGGTFHGATAGPDHRLGGYVPGRPHTRGEEGRAAATTVMGTGTAVIAVASVPSLECHPTYIHDDLMHAARKRHMGLSTQVMKPLSCMTHEVTYVAQRIERTHSLGGGAIRGTHCTVRCQAHCQARCTSSGDAAMRKPPSTRTHACTRQPPPPKALEALLSSSTKRALPGATN